MYYFHPILGKFSNERRHSIPGFAYDLWPSTFLIINKHKFQRQWLFQQNYIFSSCFSLCCRRREEGGTKWRKYRISHVLWCDMIFIQRVVWFLSPSNIWVIWLLSYIHSAYIHSWHDVIIRQTSDDSVAFIKTRLYDSIWYASPPYICDAVAGGLPHPKNTTL
jgi:hypothetical protein